MKTMPAAASAFAKRLALGEEAVARMHGLGAGLFAGGDDLLDDQIAFGRSRRPDMDGVIRHLDMQRVAIGVGIDRDGLDPHALRGLDDPAGNLAAIGDQNTLEHAPLAHPTPIPAPLALRRCGKNVNSAGRRVRGTACRQTRLSAQCPFQVPGETLKIPFLSNGRTHTYIRAHIAPTYDTMSPRLEIETWRFPSTTRPPISRPTPPKAASNSTTGLENSWGVLFSHPKDFTPVCTTELGYMARIKPEFDKRGVKIIGLSVDPVDRHATWADDIKETQGFAPNYPMIADTDFNVSKLYGMLPAAVSGDPTKRTPADNQTVRNVFVIGPDKKIKLILVYPMTTGRNFDEVLRVIDSLQLTAKHKVATPAQWKQGDDVIIAGSVSDEDAKKTYPQGWKSPKPYIRIVPQPRT